ncbi:MAG: hypothetical protein KF832_11730 [Caldilineaceae bacterium]|nr:hypothetical protein [Caldilineaceae bacterium]
MHPILHQYTRLPWPVFPLLFVLLLVLPLPVAGSTSNNAKPPITIDTVQEVHGFSGQNNARDVDIYPALAYAPALERSLLVWLSARNATSATDGLDLYGLFLDEQGNASGTPFRISDQNTVARNGPPTVVSGDREFVVAWTKRGARCSIYLQRITDSTAKSDQLLVTGTQHQHSPALIYQPEQGKYLLAFVDGDDYSPPKLLGAATDDCGNQAASTSAIKAVAFSLQGDTPQPQQSITVASEPKGAFRPALDYSRGLDQYLVAWEDRRAAAGNPARFDLYTQSLRDSPTINNSPSITLTGSNRALVTGIDYISLDSSATWTPRPAVSASPEQFLTTWFQRIAVDSGAQWSVMGDLVPALTGNSTPFPVFQLSYAAAHPGDGPSGYLDTTYVAATGDYLVGITAHLETFSGYFSAAQIQRVDNQGQLFSLAGTPQSAAGSGEAVDLSIAPQISLAMLAPPSPSNSSMLVLYGKHPPNKPAQDFNIWGARLLAPTPSATVTATPTPQTATPSPTTTVAVPTTSPTRVATPTAPAIGGRDLYLPLIQQK